MPDTNGAKLFNTMDQFRYASRLILVLRGSSSRRVAGSLLGRGVSGSVARVGLGNRHCKTSYSHSHSTDSSFILYIRLTTTHTSPQTTTVKKHTHQNLQTIFCRFENPSVFSDAFDTYSYHVLSSSNPSAGMATIMASRPTVGANAPAVVSNTAQSHPYTCNTCQVAFRNSDLQRSHMRTDWQ